MLNKEYIAIHKGQWLKDLFLEIPSNKIISKTLTGIGATTMEIMNPYRNSIIVLPNVPAIMGKVKEHEGQIKIRFVKQGVRKETIMHYLTNQDIGVKKLLTTPESFHLIVEVMELVDIDMHKDYFLLIDECDKMVLDSDYRKRISDPMWHFFNFENKALISATAIEPSDPMFAVQNFAHLIIKPQFDFSIDVELLVTNNPVQALLKKYKDIKALKDDAPIFVFFDSVLGILTTIEKLKLKAGYSIFCSSTSRAKIKKDTPHLEHIHTDMDYGKLRKINFLTSRFFTAVDVKLNKSPHVIIVSDVVKFPHTMIDPNTDVVQIKGRFRDVDINTLTCISNHKMNIFYRTKDEADEYLTFNKYAYDLIKDRKDLSILAQDKEVITDVLETLPYSNFMLTEEVENHFMIDNFHYKNRLTAMYTYPNNWIEAFKKENMLHHYFNPKVVTFYTDVRNGYLTRFKKKFKDTVKDVVDTLEKAKASAITLFEEETKAELELNYPEIMEAFALMGKDELLALGTSKSKLEKEILLYRQTKGFYENIDVFKEVGLTLELDVFYTETHLRSLAETLIAKYVLPFSVSQYMKFWKKMFLIGSRTSRKLDGKEQKGYRLLEKRFVF